jgi:hypothetical protein
MNLNAYKLGFKRRYSKKHNGGRIEIVFLIQGCFFPWLAAAL